MKPNAITSRYDFTMRIEKDESTSLDLTVSARGTKSEIDKAVGTIKRLLEEYAPTVEDPLKAIGPGQTVTIPAPPPEVVEVAREISSAIEAIPPEKRSAPHSPGVTGVLKLKCPECHRSFGTYKKEPVTEVSCNCGHHIPVEKDTLAKFHYTCPYCEKESWGLTNMEDPEIEVVCVCKGLVNLTWDSKARIYKN